MQSAQVQPLVGGLRSHILRGMAKKFFKTWKWSCIYFLKTYWWEGWQHLWSAYLSIVRKVKNSYLNHLVLQSLKKKNTQMYRTEFWTLWEKARVGCFKRTASKHVYYLGWNRSPAQAGCMRQVPSPGALGRPRGIGWRGRWEGGSEWGIHVNPWLIHVNVWQKPLQYCKVISLQLIKINEKKKTKNNENHSPPINWSTMAVRDPWKAAQISLYQ